MTNSNTFRIGVSALIFNDKGQVLLSLRGKEARNEQGKWEIPGGEVEFNESLKDAVKREVREEVGVEIEVIQLHHVFEHFSNKDHWVSLTYLCRITQGEPKIMEVNKSEKVEWYPISEVEQLDLSEITKDDFIDLKKRIKGVDHIELPFA